MVEPFVTKISILAKCHQRGRWWKNLLRKSKKKRSFFINFTLKLDKEPTGLNRNWTLTRHDFTLRVSFEPLNQCVL